MSDFDYRMSTLWRKYLALQDQSDPYAQARGRLRVSFEKTRALVVPLVANIAAELPSLTMHDITHLDALWNVADVLIGDEFAMNPAEAYVLGLAFLVHDAATSSFAFTKGIEELRQTVQWNDFVNQQNWQSEDLAKGSPQYQRALFETLRMLHAVQAESLLTASWKDLDSLERYLIEDVELRNHYGHAVGKIAASHGLDAAAAETQWAYTAPMSTHSSLGVNSKADWTVDCLKIAMLIRCIDAAHIDSLRAPDVRACFAAPVGESLHHWRFQNKLGTIAINQKAEIYWSSSAFDQASSDAWWRCYETCQMIDKEIKVANRILNDHNRSCIKAIGVHGAQDITLFQKNVPVQGWVPVDFSFQVSQVGSIIEKFGGERLYGKQPYFALRELIQNAADAIRARRLYCDKPMHGQLDVCLKERSGEWWLDVIDDGIGMSRYVLTEVLLDFGRSLWKDSALRYQWGGLASKGFTSMGQFGIGFFSVFMLGDEVKVTTWQYGAAIDQQSTLHLRNRVSERPILISPAPVDRLSEPGTRISIKLRDGRSSLLQKYDTYETRTAKKISVEENIDDLVGWLAPALDIHVSTQDGEGARKSVVVANDWSTLQPSLLLRRLYPRASQTSIEKYVKTFSEIIENNGKISGRGSLNHEDSYVIEANGCLSYKGIRTGTCQGITGILLSENNSDLARNSASPDISAEAFTRWAEKQVHGKNDNSPKLTERGVSLGVVDESLIVGRMDGRLVSIKDIVIYFQQDDVFELVFMTSDPDCPDSMSQSKFDELELLTSVIDLTACSSERRFDFGFRDWLSETLPEDEDNPKTVIELIANIVQSYIDEVEIFDDERIVGMVDDDEIEEICVVMIKNQ